MEMYYIDFSSWVIEAEDDGHAIERAIELLKLGSPDISSVEPTHDVSMEIIEYLDEGVHNV